MDSVDLNIDNYDLKDILNLFNISFTFGKEELKECKRQVYKIHPDKSGLDKDYFIFFGKAYNILVNIYNFKNTHNKDTEYSVDTIDKDKNEAIKKFTTSDNFLEQFNELFEQNKLSDEFRDNGYGEWLKTDIDSEITDLHNKHLSREEKLHRLEQLKRANHQIIEYNNITDYQNNNGGFSHLTNDKPSSYGDSNIFSKLQYEDLKEAHSTSLIHVLDSDRRKENYNNVDELLNHRSQKINPLSQKDSMDYLTNKQHKTEEESVARAFKLAKQTQESEYIRSRTEGFFYRLTN